MVAFLAAGAPGSTGPMAARELPLAGAYIVLFSLYGWYRLRLALPVVAPHPPE